MSEPILLTDEQMREFIVNGYLVFEPTVPTGTHEACYRKLNEILNELVRIAYVRNRRVPLVTLSRDVINKILQVLPRPVRMFTF